MSDQKVFTASGDFEKGLEEAMNFFQIDNKDLLEHNTVEGKKSLFGLKKGETEYQFYLAKDPLFLTEEFLDQIFTISNINAQTELELKQNTVRVNIKKSEDDDLFSEQEGELIRAIEHCLKIYLNRALSPSSPIRARVSSETFSDEHETRLHTLARKKKNQALKNSSDAIIKPLSPSDRYIIHQYLDKDPQVTTISIGEGHFKRIKVQPILTEENDIDGNY